MNDDLRFWWYFFQFDVLVEMIKNEPKMERESNKILQLKWLDCLGWIDALKGLDSITSW